jgi:thiol-disulfide isomerase/thioredoxin
MRPTRLLSCALVLPALMWLAGCGHADEKPGPDPAKPSGGASADRGFVMTEVAPAADALSAALQAEIQKAKGQGLKPYVEFSATWCEPCMAIKHSLDDPQMKAAFKGTYIIQLNADAWQGKLTGTGFSAGSIPVFYELGDDGKPTGRKIDGGAWGDNIPANMAPPLDKFFHGA